MRDIENDNVALRSLYDDLLCGDRKYLDSLKDDARKARQGLPTGLGLHSIDAKGVIRDHELVVPKYGITIVAARTGGGKTTTMIDLACRLSKRGYNGIYVTLEEPAHAITAKMLSNYSARQNPNHSMNRLGHFEALEVISGDRETPMREGFEKEIVRRCRVIDANKTVNTDKIESPTVLYYPQYIASLIKYRNSKADKPLDFVFIDFGQLLESIDGATSSFERIRSVMQALKNLAGSLGLSVIIGAQMKRECFGLNIWEWEPELIRDGSDMEQAAALILAIGKDNDEKDEERNMAIRFMKNRNGPKRVAGMFKIQFENCFIPDKSTAPVND